MAFSLRAARSAIRCALAAATGEQASILDRDLAARIHEARAGEIWLKTKSELARRGLEAEVWCRNQLGVTARSMEHRAYLHKNWQAYETARRQAPDEGWHGLVYALALIRRELGKNTGNHKPTAASLGSIGLRHGTLAIGMNPETVDDDRWGDRASVTQALDLSQPISLSPTSVLYHGDCAGIMQRFEPGSVDLVIADPPFYLPRDDRAVIDYYLAKNGMNPRFQEDWDHFHSFDDYVAFTESWIDAAFRALAETGSMFIWTTFHNAGAVNYALQRQGRSVLNNIVWLKRNPRPVLSTRRLQFSHDCIVWAANTDRYRFNYDQLYAASYEGDGIKKQGRQHRDVIEASVAGREGHGHPSAKPVGVYERLLDMAGKPGGLLLDPFAGSGTAAVAAARWGMRCLSIDRELRYLEGIKQRMSREMKNSPAKAPA